MLRNKRVLWILVALTALAVDGWGQQTYHLKLSGPLTKRRFVAPSTGLLTLKLANLPPEKEWILGVRTQPGSEIQLRAVAITFKAGTRHLQAIEPVDPWLDEASDDTIVFSRLADMPGALAAFLAVPPGTLLRIQSDTASFFQMRVAQGLMVRNGQILPRAPENLGHVLTTLSFPETSHEPIALPGGAYRVSTPALRSHVTQMALPDYTGLEGSASVAVWIDGNGIVTRIKRLRGDTQLLDAIESAVRQWRFRPFIVEGKAVVALATIAFSFYQGEVLSTLQRDVLPVAGPARD